MSNNDSNYKLKYQDLKASYMSSVDTAFRLGYEQGLQDAQVQQTQQMQAQQQMVEQNAQGQAPEEGSDDQAMDQDGQEQPISANPNGSELDQHINELEGLVSKSESLDQNTMQTLKKSLNGLKSMKVSQDLKKSQEAINSIAKNLHKPAFKISQQANANLSNNSKRALSMQHQIVNEVMSGWEKAEKDATSKISTLIATQNAKKD